MVHLLKTNGTMFNNLQDGNHEIYFYTLAAAYYYRV